MTRMQGAIDFFAKFKNLLKEGNDFRVHITGGLGTLINNVVYE